MVGGTDNLDQRIFQRGRLGIKWDREEGSARLSSQRKEKEFAEVHFQQEAESRCQDFYTPSLLYYVVV